MKLIRILFLIALSATDVSGQYISDYMTFTGWGACKNNSKEVKILRKFLKNGTNNYFTVFLQSLRTKVFPSDSISVYQVSWETIKD